MVNYTFQIGDSVRVLPEHHRYADRQHIPHTFVIASFSEKIPNVVSPQPDTVNYYERRWIATRRLEPAGGPW